ncbi:GGDEF domain-containing protein [Kineosporia sp. J2-2]|uniref:GGDEF domain-containing protein n=1 Tax=Kineosporia corallincola TaxID=2835133 RepID=A0ABS5THC8_9ACTN|nr:GGDEF domain-containing protein [Kineosporia corallincola]MBT0769453.1 GGDEF domain-containing protein [Kineosporia corallincola]
MNGIRTTRRHAELLCRVGAELLNTPVTDATLIRMAGWGAMSDLVDDTPGLRAVRLARTAEGYGMGPWLGPFPDRPGALVVPAGADPDVPEVHEALNAAAGVTCTWLMITYPDIAPEVTMALGCPGHLDAAVVFTAQGILNQVMLAYRTSLLHAQLDQSHLHDGLTRLGNRQAFTEGLREALETRASDDTVLFIDLDDFTGVNDTHGHAFGDEVLLRVADLLREVVRGDDVVARLGSDEFAVLLHGIDRATAEQIADRIVFAVSTLMVDDARQVSLAAGIGVVAIEPGTDMAQLLVRADIALRAAKTRGRGQVQVFRPDLLPTGHE